MAEVAGSLVGLGVHEASGKRAGVTAGPGGTFVLGALAALGVTAVLDAGEGDVEEPAVRVVAGVTAMPAATVVMVVKSVLGGVVVADEIGVTGATAAGGAAALLDEMVALSEAVARRLGGQAASVVVLLSDLKVQPCTAAAPQNGSASFAVLRTPFSVEHQEASALVADVLAAGAVRECSSFRGNDVLLATSDGRPLQMREVGRTRAAGGEPQDLRRAWQSR